MACQRLILKITERLPTPSQVAHVYAVIVMALYGWTISWTLWKIPSWTYTFPINDILGICAYALATVFLESVIVLSALLVLCVLLPQKWFHESFVARASILVILSLGYLMYFSYSFKSIEEKDYPQMLANWTPVVILLICLLTYAIGRSRQMSSVIEEFSSRAEIFSYIAIPFSILSLLYIILRNLFWNSING